MKTSYPLHKIKVVLLENIHQGAVDAFRKAGFTVEHLKRGYNDQELLDVAKDAHIIGVRSKSHLTAEFLAQAQNLWAIGCFCIGTNQVDLPAAAARGIPVFNAPFSNTRSVAELVISEVVALHRRLFDRSALMHAGQWRKSSVGSHEIRGRTIGIVGYGRIGSQASVLAEAMGMRVRFYDIVNVLPMGNAQGCATLEELLEVSDVVTLHVPATDQTAGMMGAEQIAQMKPGAFLLNNARGNVVDIDALVAALKSGAIGGAAVDVFPVEPSSNTEAFTSPLCGIENVILTPHIGGSTAEAQQNIGDSVSSRLIKHMNNGSSQTAVNVPEVALPRKHDGHHRILHFHHNVPGVLSQMHSAIAGLGVNISAQFLQSNPKHAYAIMDVEPKHDAELKARLGAIPETIRIRTIW